MANAWFRMYSELATDPKVQVLTEALQRRYVMLLCLNCDEKYQNAPDDEIALALRISIDDWHDTKKTLIARRLLNEDGSIHGWEKRQYISDIKDPTAAERQRRYRDNKRNGTVTSRPPEADTEPEPEQEKEISLRDMPTAPPAAPPMDPCPITEIVETYHRVLPELRQVRELNDTRQKLIRSRWREQRGKSKFADRKTGIEYFERFFTFVRTSEFLMGRVNRRDGPPFEADLEWLMRPTNFAKVVEGKYHHE